MPEGEHDIDPSDAVLVARLRREMFELGSDRWSTAMWMFADAMLLSRGRVDREEHARVVGEAVDLLNTVPQNPRKRAEKADVHGLPGWFCLPDEFGVRLVDVYAHELARMGFKNPDPSAGAPKTDPLPGELYDLARWHGLEALKEPGDVRDWLVDKKGWRWDAAASSLSPPSGGRPLRYKSFKKRVGEVRKKLEKYPLLVVAPAVRHPLGAAQRRQVLSSASDDVVGDALVDGHRRCVGAVAA